MVEKKGESYKKNLKKRSNSGGVVIGTSNPIGKNLSKNQQVIIIIIIIHLLY